jgi:hypothetical protein
VWNSDPAASITVTICAVNVRCKPPKVLGLHGVADMAAQRVNGSIRYADGNTITFDAQNPQVGPPRIALNNSSPILLPRPFRTLFTQRCEQVNGYLFALRRSAPGSSPDKNNYVNLSISSLGRIDPTSCRNVG